MNLMLGIYIGMKLLGINMDLVQGIRGKLYHANDILFQKGGGYHLDLMIVGVMISVSSVLGLPWCVAATVLSLGHVDSLKITSESNTEMIGVRYL